MTTPPVAFMNDPLVIWVQTFCESGELSYQELLDGVFLNDVMHEIDSRSTVAVREVKDAKCRLKNWNILIKNIQVYYQEVLQQLVVMKLPNVPLILRESNSGQAQQELQKVLLLILGCAVQCERKEAFIQSIQQLQIKVQQAIVEHIQEDSSLLLTSTMLEEAAPRAETDQDPVTAKGPARPMYFAWITDNRKNVFAIELLEEEQVTEVTQVIFDHLRSVITERDGYVEEIRDLRSNLEDLYEQQNEIQKRPPSPPTALPEKHHMAVELAECKAKLRKLRQELEEKSELTSEVQDDLDEHKIQLTKLRSENLELVHEARSARTYRDELDIYKEKASRVDKLEYEIARYKEKLQEQDFHKSRVAELREDNSILLETKNVLEDQLSSLQTRLDGLSDLENELLKSRNQLQELHKEREREQQKLTELVEANARLEYEKKSSFTESASLEEELIRARSQLHEGLNNSLSNQLNESSSAKALRLELENKRLLQKLSEREQKVTEESSGRSHELEKENHRLAMKVEKLQMASSSESQTVLDMEARMEETRKEVDVMQQTLNTVRESGERQTRELERENHQLSQQVAALRERTEKTENLRVKEVEAENSRLHERNSELNAEVSKLDYELRGLQKEHTRLQGAAESQSELEAYNTRLQKQVADLHKQVATLKLMSEKYDKLEASLSDTEFERDKLARQVVTLQQQLDEAEVIEQDNVNLTVELQTVRRSLEAAKSSGARQVDLQAANEQLQQALAASKRRIESMNGNQAKNEQLEVNLLELDTDNQRLTRTLEAATRRAEELQRDLTTTENTNAQLQKNLDSLKLSLRRLEELEKDNRELESENSSLTKSKAQVEKENKRLKQALEMRETALDEASSTLSLLEKENKQLTKAADKYKENEFRLHEHEKENTELLQRAELDKKTLSNLREDLVNEKIRTQQLSNELDKLTQELEKVGLNKEKLTAAEETDNKYKALESLMEDALHKSMAIKEEKIHALESRLHESKSRNVRLQDELRDVKRQYEALQQRREEEGMPPSRDKERISFPNATREILELKDHLITLERNNARLEAENEQMRSSSEQVQRQLGKAESLCSHLQGEVSSQHAMSQSLQAQLAQVQVENSTLVSRGQALQTQLASAQAQHEQMQREQERLLAEHEELQMSQRALSSDHDALQRLHEQLTSEYEALITDHGKVKATSKTLRGDLRELQQQTSDMKREKDTLTQIKQAIEDDRYNLRTEAKSMGSLQLDLVSLREENIRLRSTHDKLQTEYHDLMAEHKAIKTELNQMRLRHSELQRSFGESRDQLNAFDVDISKMGNQCEALSQLNTTLEEENRSLMMQMQALLNQNHELLTSSLQSRDHFHEEERAYMEKMAELRRQKEKLEEKIMEQYRRYDPVKKKNRSFGANLVRKARGLINKANRSRPKTPTFGESMDKSSADDTSMDNQEHYVEASSFLRKKRNRRERRNSLGDILDKPRLGSQKKALAKSTTALHMLKDEGKKEKGKLRGAKSTENLLSTHDTPKSSRRASEKDNDSLSSSNSSYPNIEWPNKPPRRRTILENGGQYGSGRQGSLSSEDTRDNGVSMMSSPRSNNGSDDDAEISLFQFLEESNRSPASRRKLLLAKRIDPDNIRTDTLETTALPPPNFMTPRGPTLDEETLTAAISPSARRRLATSKSESGLTTLALGPEDFQVASNQPGLYTPQLYHRDRSLSAQSPRRTDGPMGLSPKLDSSQHHQSRADQRPRSRTDLDIRPMSRPDLSQRPRSRADFESRPQSRAESRPQSRADYESRPQSRIGEERASSRCDNFNSSHQEPPSSPSRSEFSHNPQSHSTPLRSHSISDPHERLSNTLPRPDHRSHSVTDTRTAMLPQGGAYNHSTTYSESRPAPVGQAFSSRNNSRSRQGSDASSPVRKTNEPIYGSLPRKPSGGWVNGQPGDGVASLRRSGSSCGGQVTSYGDYMQMDPLPDLPKLDIIRDPPIGDHVRSPPNGDVVRGPPNGTSQKDSSNVQRMVRNYQKSMRPERPKVEPPVPPPRKARPNSAGPLHPENVAAMQANANFTDSNHSNDTSHSMSTSLGSGGGSAFSAPRRANGPSYTTINITMNSNNPGQDDRQRPVEKVLPPEDLSGVGPSPPGSTPLVPGKEEKPKNAVWYEYGCV